MAKFSSLWKPFISINNSASLCSEWKEARKTKPHQTKKNPKESDISHHLTCNSWAVRVMPVCWSVRLILFLTHSSPNAHQAHYEMNLQEFNQRNQLTGTQCSWFLWFGSNKHLPYAAAQCCPQSTTPDTWSFIRTGVPPWRCLEDENVWQWWPETNRLQEPILKNLTEKAHNVKDSKTSDLYCSLLNFQITKKAGIS